MPTYEFKNTERFKAYIEENEVTEHTIQKDQTWILMVDNLYFPEPVMDGKKYRVELRVVYHLD